MADEKKIYHAPPLVRDPLSQITVDIIIPFHAQAEKMIRAVQSIYKHTKFPNYQICLVDDCSPNDQIHQSFASAPRLKYVRTPKHVGFGGAVDMGLHSTESQWVCVMHSDCVVTQPRWLEEMVRCMGRLRSYKVMMVSARTDNPGDGAPHCLKSPRNSVGEDVVIEEGFLPMYCTLMHRQMFRILGSYLKVYPYAMYEDEELAARMKAKGLRQAACGTSWISHLGGATINYLCRMQESPGYEGPDYRGIMESNYERCVSDIASLRATTTGAAGRP